MKVSIFFSSEGRALHHPYDWSLDLERNSDVVEASPEHPECIALRSYAPAQVAPSLGEVVPPLDLLVESLEVKTMNRRLLLDLLVPASLIILLVSFACKFFLDHTQNFAAYPGFTVLYHLIMGQWAVYHLRAH